MGLMNLFRKPQPLGGVTGAAPNYDWLQSQMQAQPPATPSGKLPWSDRLSLIGTSLLDLNNHSSNFGSQYAAARQGVQDQQDQADYAGLFNAARNGGADPTNAELDYIAQHPRLSKEGLALMAPGETVVVGDHLVNKRSGKSIYDAPEKPDKLPEWQIMGPDGKPMINPLYLDMKHRTAEATHITVNGPASGGLTNSGLDLAAQQYRMTGQMPPLGMGSSAAALRQKIINRAADLATVDGEDAEGTIVGQSGFKASASALKDIRTRRARLEQAEKFASRNLDLVEQAATGVSRFGAPLLNDLAQRGINSMVGDPALTRFQNAIETFVPEYAKVMSGGNPVLSDAATHRAEGLLKSSMNPKQFKAAVSQLRAEMANQGPSYDEQERGILEAMRTKKGDGAPQRPAGVPPNAVWDANSRHWKTP